MPFSSLPTAEQYRRQRRCEDFYRHALVGPVFYVLGCIVASQSDASLRQDWRFTIAAPVVMALLVLLRWLNRPPAQQQDEAGFAAWYRLRWTLIYIGCACWTGFAMQVTLRTPTNATAAIVVQLCTVAFGAASASAYALDFRRNVLSIAVLFLPQITSLVLAGKNYPIAITLAIFFCYLIAASRRYSRDYNSQLALEYELLSSRHQIHRMSLIDDLTGLYNRRRFNEVFQQSWLQAQRTDSALSLVLADIDHFKQINDQHGHQVGDVCLQVFAQQLQHRFRRLSDHVMRIGGEEFAVVLPGTSTEEAHRLVNELLQELREQPAQTAAGAITLQASFGIAGTEFSRDLASSDMLKRADDALYAAKQAGRARAITAD